MSAAAAPPPAAAAAAATVAPSPSSGPAGGAACSSSQQFVSKAGASEGKHVRALQLPLQAAIAEHAHAGLSSPTRVQCVRPPCSAPALQHAPCPAWPPRRQSVPAAAALLLRWPAQWSRPLLALLVQQQGLLHPSPPAPPAPPAPSAAPQQQQQALLPLVLAAHRALQMSRQAPGSSAW